MAVVVAIDKPLYEIIRSRCYPWQATRAAALQHNRLCGRHMYTLSCITCSFDLLTAFPIMFGSDEVLELPV